MAGQLIRTWIEGMDAGRNGGLASTNPHPRGTELAGHWADGWRDGDRQRQERAEVGRGSPQAEPKTSWSAV